MSKRFVSLFIAAALGATPAAIAHAATPASDDAVSVKVSLGDLNLSSRDGAQTALRRITTAAKGICGDAPAPMELGRSAAYKSCVGGVVANAVAHLNAPMVSALEQGSTTRQFASAR